MTGVLSMLRLMLAAILLAAPAAAPAQSFDLLGFFTGETRGEGSLKILLRRSVPIKVESRGKPDGRGGIVIDQTIREGAKPPRQRKWVLRPTSATTLTGTITDNPGPVTGRLVGSALHLRYNMKGGLRVEQVLTPAGNGKTIQNHMAIRRFGVVVARVDETIRKLD